MRKFQNRQDHCRVAYVAGVSSLSSLDWVEDRTFEESQAAGVDRRLEPVFQRARQLGVAFVREDGSRSTTAAAA
jgi:hypothetical protein